MRRSCSLSHNNMTKIMTSNWASKTNKESTDLHIGRYLKITPHQNKVNLLSRQEWLLTTMENDINLNANRKRQSSFWAVYIMKYDQANK